MSIIIDGGACVGEWFQPLYKATDDYHCFEPLLHNFTALKNRFDDRPNVTCVHAALGGFNGTAGLVRGIPSPGGQFWGGTIQADKYNAASDEMVPVLKLSDYWKENINARVAILKMNIEGSEYDVFEDLLDSGLINEFDIIRYQDHGIRGSKVIPSCRDKAYEVFPRLQKEFKGTLQFIVGSVHNITTEIPEYLR